MFVPKTDRTRGQKTKARNSSMSGYDTLQSKIDMQQQQDDILERETFAGVR
jgi:hypothetical protein